MSKEGVVMEKERHELPEENNSSNSREYNQFKQRTANVLERSYEAIDELETKNRELTLKLRDQQEELKKVKQLNTKYKRRLNSLEKSKLGRLTKKYWSIRKAIFGKGGRR
ncbi:hypothetical protein EQV77_09015 [Halobacillus fulvus]|nr:hypothetical protein EQV77_09015 [Halobacillus fulvus]